MTLCPPNTTNNPPPMSELDLAYLRLKAATSDEELRESLDLIARLQAPDLTKESNCGVKGI
jgi:hypothetical protein